MSNPEIGLNLTQVPSDILLRLVDATEEIRDLLRQKAGEENGTTQQTNGASHQGKDSPEVPGTTAHQPLNSETTNVETDNSVNWPNDEMIAKYKNRCAKHKSECEKMQVELGCLIAHLNIVRGDEDTIDKAKSLRKGLLDPVQCLEKAFDATPDGRRNLFHEVRRSFDRLDDFVRDFALSPHQEDTLYLDKSKQWWDFTRNGYFKMHGLVHIGKFVECLEFIHDVFFFELETAMGGVVEALTIFEEKSASEWLAAQKIKDFEDQCERYITSSYRQEPEKIANFAKQFTAHSEACNKMHEELGHLNTHYGIVGGDTEVVKAAKELQDELLLFLRCLQHVSNSAPGRDREMISVIVSFRKLHFSVSNFMGSLYHQKHAFYFRKVKQWTTYLWNGLHKPLFFLVRDSIMVGVGTTHPVSNAIGEKPIIFDAGSVAEELKTFGKESLPKFLVDQMERDTTRYVNLTTIATFFSSVTATTLQFTYAETDSVPSNSLRGVVNLFWFLSLVFSVSSGVNSLLGLTWRKSSIYDSRVPPRLIRMWFDKAPMLFLIIAAVAFVIGLNLFAYLSLQPRYVSFATNILTGLHGACMLVVTAWFIYQLKHKSIWAGWVRTVMKLITTIAERINLAGMKWTETGVKWLKTGVKWTYKLVKWPYEKYKQNLHWQRNIYWAFGIDNRVASLNFDIGWERDGPEPYLLSKLIRCIAYAIKRCWLMTKKAISDLSRTVRAHICVSSRTEHAGDDVEMGESVRREEAEVPEEISSESLAKNEFRKSLQTVFSEADRVDDIMWYVGYWERGNEEDAERGIGKLLWGYPALVTKFHEGLRPVLIEAREKRRREREEAGQQRTTTEHVDNAPEGVAENENDTTSVPPPAPLDDGSSPLVTTHADGQQGSEDQPDYHRHTPDERPPLTATSVATEALESTSTDPVPQPVIGETAASPNEAEEFASTSKDNNEGTRMPQRKEDPIE